MNRQPRPLHLLQWLSFKLDWSATRFYAELFYHYYVYRREVLAGQKGVLLVANHASHLDVPVLSGITTRVIHFIARRSLAKSLFMRRVLWETQAILVERDGSDREAVTQAVQLLQAGELVAVFPEGTRSPDGRMQPFKRGAELIARRAGVPIVPVGIAGTYQIFPRHRRLPRPTGRIRVHLGDPIPPDQTRRKDLDLQALVGELVDRARRAQGGE